ncbi:MAG: flavin reductase family protein [Thermodesulfobacteriota bacterium]
MSFAEGSAVAGVFWSYSPVVVITSENDNEINGQVAVTVVTSSIVSSIPRLIVGIWKGNYTHSFIYNSRKLNIHLLKKDQFDLVRNFGFYTGREKDKFKGIDYELGSNNCPVLKNVHSYMQCEVINAMDGGDMTPFLVNVVDGKVFDREHWMTLSDFYTYAPEEWIAEYDKKLAKSIQYSMPIIHDISYKPFKP